MAADIGHSNRFETEIKIVYMSLSNRLHLPANGLAKICGSSSKFQLQIAAYFKDSGSHSAT